MITVHEVKSRLEEIRKIAEQDDESAHSKEDALYRDVLKAIADGSPEERELAKEALRSRLIEFSRWCG